MAAQNGIPGRLIPILACAKVHATKGLAMMRVIVGVIVGYAVWTAIWLAVNAMVFAEAGEVIAAGDAFTETGPLLGVLASSIACSLAGGVAAAVTGGRRARGAVLGAAVLLLATGILIQAGIWSLMPVWYHLIFLALLVPVTLLGGMFVPRQSAN